MLRASGLVILALAICLAVISVPPRLEQIAAVCAAPPCVQGQLSPEGARTAEDHGLSLGSYAGLTTALDVAAVATYLAVALVLFWRKGPSG